MSVWLIVIIIAALTFVQRLSFVSLFGRLKMPPLLQRGLRFVPAAVLPALVFPAVIYGNDSAHLSVNGVRLLAALLAGLVAWRTQNVLLTLIVGMVGLWVLQTLL